MLYTKILKNPEVEKLLVDYIKDIVGNLMNPKALEKRINYLYNFFKVDMYWDVFCRNNIVKTQFFSTPDDDELEPISIEEIENEYKGNGGRNKFSNFVQQWIGEIAKIYGVQVPQNPVTEGKFGKVGVKLMTIDDDGDEDDSKDNSGVILSSNYSLPLLFTLISVILVWIMN